MDINATFSQARELARQGDRQAARQLLEAILQQEPKNEEVLLWYALLAPTKAEVIDGLQLVLEINPNNVQAQQRLAKLQAGSGVPASTPSNSSPFAYEAARSEEPPATGASTFTADAAAPAAPAYTPAVSAVPSTPLDASAASPALIKRLDTLIAFQEHMDRQINKINRVAQFFFWLAIVSLVLSLISVCLAIAGVLPLLNSANTLIGG
ncbi:hypothetical protein LARV_00106 [Longilinea arvoryzae]|uniref:Uncharacterized protein n=1 Tax=Longilinea arvoryzae TaxID=360412 RepID=A0A0S7BCI5_9CHLR|nr:tetratricopeptide repeat protein [Longilinea arvoryzae]GAP12372.1 hypothetical protein LARV_00106 [Longilinea arvoryzae]